MSFWCLQILPKNERKQVDLRFIVVKSNFFVHFLEELRIPKSPFEINWPLKIVQTLVQSLFVCFDMILKTREPLEKSILMKQLIRRFHFFFHSFLFDTKKIYRQRTSCWAGKVKTTSFLPKSTLQDISAK